MESWVVGSMAIALLPVNTVTSPAPLLMYWTSYTPGLEWKVTKRQNLTHTHTYLTTFPHVKTDIEFV